MPASSKRFSCVDDVLGLMPGKERAKSWNLRGPNRTRSRRSRIVQRLPITSSDRAIGQWNGAKIFVGSVIGADGSRKVMRVVECYHVELDDHDVILNRRSARLPASDQIRISRSGSSSPNVSRPALALPYVVELNDEQRRGWFLSYSVRLWRGRIGTSLYHL